MKAMGGMEQAVELARESGARLRERGLTLATVESATGVLIAHLITGIPGSSDYFSGGVVAYSDTAKVKIAGVSRAAIEEHGAVSAEVAGEMAAGGRRLFGADICLADTGIAGPGGATPQKQVGLFYMGLSHRGGTSSRRHVFTGARAENKEAAALAALEWLMAYLGEPG